MEENYRGTALILENSERKILMQLRDNNPGIRYPNFWALPGGGAEEGETPEDAIKREIKEETNYELINPKYIGNFLIKKWKLYVFSKYDPKLKLEDLEVNEGQELKFFSLEEILRLKIVPHHLPRIKEYFKKSLFH
ncbi:NUDIX domain-containing protein [Candidatus Woesearchaeota archaeon]|nr:NUDIX domain-containing protein [Candidatus Woesearchaeota archaeon]